MEPVQEGAVLSDDAVARLATLTCAVSVLPRPTGGKMKCRVVVVVLGGPCAKTEAATRAARKEVTKKFRMDIIETPWLTFLESVSRNRNQPESPIWRD